MVRPPPPNPRNNLKQSPIPVVSRTMPIVNQDGTVTRSGQLLLEQLQPVSTTFGPHSSRPDPSSMGDGAVYIETDRGSIYQNQGGIWQYVTGTMWATLNPDQRPTDLGVTDGGFVFRTTDDPAREFLWSQTEWIEATPVRYGTHAARLAVVVAQVIDQLLWVETDRGVLYQLQNGTTWQYIAGTMWGTMSPDQRPTDLGTHDAGFDYRSTDAPPREFIWSQTAWVEVTPPAGGAYQYVIGTSTQTLTTAATAVPGLTLTLGRPGVYSIRATLDFQMVAGDTGAVILGSLTIDGAAVSAPVIVWACQSVTGSQTGRATCSNEWLYTAPVSGHVVAMVASKTGGTGSSACFATNSILSATWIHA